jgi:hypothetical protein
MRRRIVLHDLRNSVRPSSDYLTAACGFELHFVVFSAFAVVQRLEGRNDPIVVAGAGDVILDRCVVCSCADAEAI